MDHLQIILDKMTAEKEQEKEQEKQHEHEKEQEQEQEIDVAVLYTKLTEILNKLDNIENQLGKTTTSSLDREWSTTPTHTSRPTIIIPTCTSASIASSSTPPPAPSTTPATTPPPPPPLTSTTRSFSHFFDNDNNNNNNNNNNFVVNDTDAANTATFHYPHIVYHDVMMCCVHVNGNPNHFGHVIGKQHKNLIKLETRYNVMINIPPKYSVNEFPYIRIYYRQNYGDALLAVNDIRETLLRYASNI